MTRQWNKLVLLAGLLAIAGPVCIAPADVSVAPDANLPPADASLFNMRSIRLFQGATLSTGNEFIIISPRPRELRADEPLSMSVLSITNQPALIEAPSVDFGPFGHTNQPRFPPSLADAPLGHSNQPRIISDLRTTVQFPAPIDSPWSVPEILLRLDLDHNGVIGRGDLIRFIELRDTNVAPLDPDGNGGDLQPTQQVNPADFNRDGVVDGIDYLILVSHWGESLLPPTLVSTDRTARGQRTITLGTADRAQVTIRMTRASNGSFVAQMPAEGVAMAIVRGSTRSTDLTYRLFDAAETSPTAVRLPISASTPHINLSQQPMPPCTNCSQLIVVGAGPSLMIAGANADGTIMFVATAGVPSEKVAIPAN